MLVEYSKLLRKVYCAYMANSTAWMRDRVCKRVYTGSRDPGIPISMRENKFFTDIVKLPAQINTL